MNTLILQSQSSKILCTIMPSLCGKGKVPYFYYKNKLVTGIYHYQPPGTRIKCPVYYEPIILHVLGWQIYVSSVLSISHYVLSKVIFWCHRLGQACTSKILFLNCQYLTFGTFRQRYAAAVQDITHIIAFNWHYQNKENCQILKSEQLIPFSNAVQIWYEVNTFCHVLQSYSVFVDIMIIHFECLKYIIKQN